MSHDVRPAAQVFHVGVFIVDEMDARGWAPGQLARHMGGTAKEQELNECALGMCLAGAFSGRPGVLLGEDLACGLERAFGVSAATWLALDAAWQAWTTCKQTAVPDP